MGPHFRIAADPCVDGVQLEYRWTQAISCDAKKTLPSIHSADEPMSAQRKSRLPNKRGDASNVDAEQCQAKPYVGPEVQFRHMWTHETNNERPRPS